MAEAFTFVRGEGPDREALSDHELLRRIAGDDEAAFEIFFHRYNRRLFAFVRDMVASEAIAKEIIQDVFLKLWLGRSGMAGIENPPAWIYRVASNHTISQIRSDLRYARHTQASAAGAETSSGDTEKQVDTRQLQAALHAALKELPPQMQQSFRLVKLDGLSRREAAATMGISEFTVKNHLVAAIKQLQTRLRDAGFTELPVILLLLLMS